MRFTKRGHSCVRLKNGVVLVIDPGTFTDAVSALNGAAVLVTHERRTIWTRTL